MQTSKWWFILTVLMLKHFWQQSITSCAETKLLTEKPPNLRPAWCQQAFRILAEAGWKALLLCGRRVILFQNFDEASNSEANRTSLKKKEKKLQECWLLKNFVSDVVKYRNLYIFKFWALWALLLFKFLFVHNYLFAVNWAKETKNISLKQRLIMSLPS